MKIRIALVGLALLLWTPITRAVMIGLFPGLDELIRKADAIVILRIDRHVTDSGNRTLSSTHDCHVYQTLKGDIPAGRTIRLQLMDTRSAFATPYGIRSTHLMFLTRKRSADEPTEYRTIEFRGANVELSPFGHEKMPAGRTVHDQIKALLRSTLEYHQKQMQNEEAFLEKMIKGTAEPHEGSNGMLLSAAHGSSAGDYSRARAAVRKRDATQRPVPVIPPREQRLRVIIDTDARNEIDDIWAIALAVLCPERFQIEGFVAANYDNDNPGGGPASIETSARAIETVLEKAGLQGKFPIRRGSPPMRYQFEPSESEGVDFIIEKAMASTPEDPLWIIGLGAATDIASAYLKEPGIAERIMVFWHFRTEWPRRCWNFNVIGDVRAARLVFHSDLPFVLFDTGTHLTCPMEQSARWVEHGPLGRYLHEFRLENKYYQSPTKGFFDLGDIAALVDPSLATWEVVDCPEVNWDLAYQFKGTKGKILRCGAIDRDRTFALFEEKLKKR